MLRETTQYNYKRGTMQFGQLVGVIITGILSLANLICLRFAVGFIKLDRPELNVAQTINVSPYMFTTTGIILSLVLIYVFVHRTRVHSLFKSIFAEIITLLGTIFLVWQCYYVCGNICADIVILPFLVTQLIATQLTINSLPKAVITSYNAILAVSIFLLSVIYNVPNKNTVVIVTIFMLTMLTIALWIIDKASREIFELNKVSEEQSITDKLTGLFNRQGLGLFCNEDNTISQGGSIVMFDIDYFKKVNDTHGHDVGDMVLKSVANTVLHYKEYRDTVIRWGGEEFIIYLLDTNIRNATEWAEILRQGIARGKNTPIPITISLGVTNCFAGECVETAIKRADEALYKAKNSGRNQTCVKFYNAVNN